MGGGRGLSLTREPSFQFAKGIGSQVEVSSSGFIGICDAVGKLLEIV